MALPSPHDLSNFLVVAETKNLSRAAEKIGITQPALTLSIKRLEEVVGTELLIRSRKGVLPTKPAIKLVQQGKSLLEEWSRIKEDVLKDEELIQGTYTMGIHPSVGMYTLPRLLPDLLSEYRDLDFKLIHDLSRNVTEQVVSSTIDFALAINPVRHPDLVTRNILKDEVSLWRGPRKNKLNNPNLDSCILIYHPGLMQADWILRKWKGSNIKRVVETESLELTAKLVESGAGVGVLPSRVAGSIGQGLKKIEGSPVYDDQLALVYRVDRIRSKAAKELVRKIEVELKNIHKI